jgi:hypothetical protein
MRYERPEMFPGIFLLLVSFSNQKELQMSTIKLTNKKKMKIEGGISTPNISVSSQTLIQIVIAYL